MTRKKHARAWSRRGGVVIVKNTRGRCIRRLRLRLRLGRRRRRDRSPADLPIDRSPLLIRQQNGRGRDNGRRIADNRRRGLRCSN